MWYLVVLLIVVVAAVSLQPKPPEAKPAQLTDIDVPTAEQGRPVPKVFGRCILQSPNVIWYGDLGYNKVKAKGGK